ncbi:MAG: cytochrome C oxidase subunit IV family protein [Gammaproteobacteria bacterium]|nr:cytochrome C oxidase subunit IV family protein [Gammaproteobacteria bacterium]
MIGLDASGPRNAWLLLLLISALSLVAAEFVAERHVAIAAIMIIAAAKTLIILVRFMEVDRAPSAIRRYLYGWSLGVAGAVVALWAAAP